MHHELRFWTLFFLACFLLRLATATDLESWLEVGSNDEKLWPHSYNTKVHVYGVDDEAKNKSETFLCNHQDKLAKIDGYSQACFVAICTDSSSLIWLERCHRGPEPFLSLDVTDTLTHHVEIRGKSQRDSEAGTPLRHQTLQLEITSPTELWSLHPSLEKASRHSSVLNWHTDADGKLTIKTNVDGLLWKLTAIIGSGLEAVSELSIVGESDVVDLQVDCPSSEEAVGMIKVGAWSETVESHLPSLPATEWQAIEDGWQRVNQDCNDDPLWPGYRYENPRSQAWRWLVVIYGEHEDLVGFQLAFPQRPGRRPRGEDPHLHGQFFPQGLYDGAPANLVTFYNQGRESVCLSERNHLCYDSGALNLVVGSSASGVSIHQRSAEALANGWDQGKTNAILHRSDVPCWANYHEDRLTGLSVFQYVHDAADLAMNYTNNQIFQMEELEDLPFDAPPSLQQEKTRALRSSFYLGDIGNAHQEENNHRDPGIFYIRVKDTRGEAVQGALLKLRHHHHRHIRAAQLTTDRRGHAFVAFDQQVGSLEFEILPPKGHSLSSFWRPHSSYRLQWHHRRQTVRVERVEKARVKIKLEMDHPLDNEFLIWTSKDKMRSRRIVHDSEIEPFHIDLDVTEIHLLNVDRQSGWLTYHAVRRNLNEVDVHATLHSSKVSRLRMEETQSEKGILDAEVEIDIGLPPRQGAQRLRFQTDQVYLDVPKGTLVAWRVKSVHHASEKGSAITPFQEKVHLLKTIDVDVHICLDGSDENGAEKDAEVEAVLEYEWASQDDRREIISVNKQGNVLLRNVPSPAPGESLNLTLTSKLGSQSFISPSKHHHRSLAHHSSSIHHEAGKKVGLRLCHALESVVVVVVDAVTEWRMEDVKVLLSVEEQLPQMQVTDDEGAAFFSFQDYGNDDQNSRFHLQVWREHYDSVRLSRYIRHGDHGTDVIKVKLYPQKVVHINVDLETDHDHHRPPAIGAIVDWNADDDGGIEGADGDGRTDVTLSGKSERIHQLTASIPWQSTCGGSDDHRIVYGMVRLNNIDFPLSERPPFHSNLRLTLPRLSQIPYEMDMEDLFPERAHLHADNQVIDVEDGVRHGKVQFHVDVGVQQAFLLLEEHYSSRVVLTALESCMDVDVDALEDGGRAFAIQRRNVFSNTVRVTVKMLDVHLHRMHNVTLNYAFGHPSSAQFDIDADLETAEVVFHLPPNSMVFIKAKVPGGHHPDPANPHFFRAAEGLEVKLIFGGSHFSRSVTVALMGDGFHVPEGTVLKYVAKDEAGDPEHQGMVATNSLGKAIVDVTINTAFIDFAIGGSDGFDPIFFQPFEWIYNVTHHEDYLEIPVKSWKNVIVSVKDCYTGAVLDSRAFVKFPEDAAVPHSWYDRHLMLDRHSGYADDQGMAFFQLEPDLMIPLTVLAEGYEPFTSLISVASNTTHLVEANLCKKLTVKLKVIDRDVPVRHATVEVGVHGAKEFEVHTDSRGEATFGASTSARKLSLRLTDADESIQHPIFELHDDEGFLREADIDINILDREQWLELATVGCNHWGHFKHIDVLFKIDDHSEFVRTSNEDGIIKLRVRHDAKQVMAQVLRHDHHQTSITILPKSKMPSGLNLKTLSFPVSASIELVDTHQDDKPIAHATVGVRLGHHDFFEVTTNRHGQAFFQLPTSTEAISLQLLDASSEHLKPHFRLKDDCSDFLTANDVKIKILERMYTMDIATAGCNDFRHFANIPVLIQTNYIDDDDVDFTTQRKWTRASDGFDYEKHLREFVLTSDHDGNIRLRLHESAANVSLRVLQAPPSQEGVGLWPREDLPVDRFSFAFHSPTKNIALRVHDASSKRPLLGASAHLQYYDRNDDRQVTLTTFTNHKGQASFEIDGCVEFVSFIVSYPRQHGSGCGGRYRREKRIHWNVMEHQKFTIGLQPLDGKDVHLRLKTGLGKEVDRMTYTTSGSLDKSYRIQQRDPFLHDWHLKAKPSNQGLNILTESSHRHILGLTTLSPCCLLNYHDDDDDGNPIELFQDAAKVRLKVRDRHGKPVGGAYIKWHVGLGLGKASVKTSDKHGEALLYAPRGYMLALEAHGHYCHSEEPVLQEAQDDALLTLTCS